MDAKDLLQQDTCHYHLMAVELNEVKHDFQGLRYRNYKEPLGSIEV